MAALLHPPDSGGCVDLEPLDVGALSCSLSSCLIVYPSLSGILLLGCQRLLTYMATLAGSFLEEDLGAEAKLGGGLED